jgi:hypothetical protein
MSVYTFDKAGAPRVDPNERFNPATQAALLELVSRPHVVGLEENGRRVKIVYGFFFTDRWKPRKAWSIPFFGRRLELLYVLQADDELLTSAETKSQFLLDRAAGHLGKAVREILDPALPLEGYARGAALQLMTQSRLAAYYYATRRDGPFGPGLLRPAGRDLEFFLLGFEGEGTSRVLTISRFDLPPLLPVGTMGS